MAALTLLAACGGNGSAAEPAGGSSTGAVVQAQNGAGGKMMLVDAKGMTLYVAAQDKASDIKCTGSCLGFWFPLTTKSANPTGTGVPAGKLGTVKRPDSGTTQVTFDGKPLYTFKLDTSAGSTKGDGVTDDFGGTTFHWSAVTVSGGSPSAPSTGNTGGGGYGY